MDCIGTNMKERDLVISSYHIHALHVSMPSCSYSMTNLASTFASRSFEERDHFFQRQGGRDQARSKEKKLGWSWDHEIRRPVGLDKNKG